MNTLINLLDILVRGIAMLFALRFMLQATYADFYNPISQFVVKVTGYVAEPLRKLIPPRGRWDFASLVILFAIFFAYVMALSNASVAKATLLTGYNVVDTLLWLLMISAIAEVIMSWLGPQAYQSPIFGLVSKLNAPFLGPIRKVIPSAGGLDFTPMIYLIGIYVLRGLTGEVTNNILLKL